MRLRKSRGCEKKAVKRRTRVRTPPGCVGPDQQLRLGCPIQARFWLEWDTTETDRQLLPPYLQRIFEVRREAKTGLEWGTQP